MKAAFSFILAIGLIFALASVGSASPHSFQGYFGDFRPHPYGEGFMIEYALGLWLDPGSGIFSTGEQEPQFQIQGFFGVDGMDQTFATAEYYLNNFVFADLNYVDSGGRMTNLRGGYLWEDLGVFAAMDYADTSNESSYIASGGYRFDLGGGSYAALSLDYYGGGYDADFVGEAIVKYYADGLKLSGQLAIDDEGETILYGKANLAAGADLTWGGGLSYYDSSHYEAFLGLTWEAGSGLFDGLVVVDDEGDMLYYLSYLHGFGDALALGLNYMGGDVGSDGMIGVKGEYQLGEGELTFSYLTPVDGDGGFVKLGYEMSL